MTRRRYSPKRIALFKHYQRPWDEVALEWAGKELALSDIADAWQAETGEEYSPRTVSRLIAEATRMRSLRDTDSTNGAAT